jgi:DNA-directed RNA polymerase subunit RPC12/RpoP
MHSPNNVFYGDKPLLLSLVKDEKIKKVAFELLAGGATPGNYGHELYVCPECMRLANEFYFKLVSSAEQYEPNYDCSHCGIELCRVKLKQSDSEQIELVFKDKHKIEWKCPECSGERLVFGSEIIKWD